MTRARECARAVGVQLHLGFHSRFYFAYVFLVNFAAYISLSRRDGEKFIPVRNQFAIDRLNVG